MADYATINLRTEGPLARLTLNRPEQRNGMTNRMVRETHAALTRVAADASVRLLLLTGTGRSFCPGGGLEPNVLGRAGRGGLVRSRAFSGSGAAARDATAHPRRHQWRLRRGGIRLGLRLRPSGGGPQRHAEHRLPQRRRRRGHGPALVAAAAGRGRKARELSFFCEKFSAAEAHRFGLVARVYDDEEFQEQVEALLAELLERSPPPWPP